MIAKVRDKEKAIILRHKGYSYKDILREIHVSKSSLSCWLKDLPLTDEEKLSLKNRKDGNISQGRIKAASALRRLRLERERLLFKEAQKEFHNFISDPFFQVGIALYWAEGTKRSFSFGFANSDASMMGIMLLWIEKFLGIRHENIKVRLYIHKPYANENCEEWWSQNINVPLGNFQKTVYKPTGLLVKKRPAYKGCLRIEIGKISYMRKMIFWQKMLTRHYLKR